MADLEKIGLDGSDFTIPAGGATAGVTTFNGRNGAVVPQSGDYSAALVGLGNVDNTSDADKPVSTATQAALDLKANAADMTTALAAKADTASLATVATSGSYNDLSDKPTIPAAFTLPTASAGELGGVKVGSGLAISAEGVLSATGGGGGGTAGVETFNGRDGVVTPQAGDYTAAMVGLGNVDNTADADKPISTATQAALDLKANAADMNTALAAKANTADLAAVATSGDYDDLTNKPTIPAAYTLPTASAIELGGIKIGTGLTIDQDGVVSASGPAGVETFNGRTGTVTPQNGDYTAAMVGLGNVDNTSDANKPVSTATQTALDAKADSATVTAMETRLAALETLLSGFAATALAMSDGTTTVNKVVLAKDA